MSELSDTPEEEKVASRGLAEAEGGRLVGATGCAAVALMKSAHTKAHVLTVGIKEARVIPGVLPLSPQADLYKRLISHRQRVPVPTL